MRPSFRPLSLRHCWTWEVHEVIVLQAWVTRRTTTRRAGRSSRPSAIATGRFGTARLRACRSHFIGAWESVLRVADKLYGFRQREGRVADLEVLRKAPFSTSICAIPLICSPRRFGTKTKSVPNDIAIAWCDGWIRSALGRSPIFCFPIMRS